VYILIERPTGKRSFGKLGAYVRLILMGTAMEIGCQVVHWIKLAKDSDCWNVVVNTIMKILVS
jgi:hypothetical protein